MENKATLHLEVGEELTYFIKCLSGGLITVDG